MAGAQGCVLPPEGSSAAMLQPQLQLQPQHFQLQQPQRWSAAALPVQPAQRQAVQQVAQQAQQFVWQQPPQQQQAAPPQPAQQRAPAPMHPTPLVQPGQLQQAAQVARQAAAAAATVVEQQAAVVAELEQRLRSLEKDYKANLEGAEAATARLPAPLGPALLVRSREALTASYQQRRAQVQQELQQAAAAGKAASQVQQQQQQAEATAAEQQLQQHGLGKQPWQQAWQQPLRPKPIRLQQLPAALGPRQQQQGQAQQREEPKLRAQQSGLPKGIPATVGGMVGEQGLHLGISTNVPPTGSCAPQS